MLTRLKISGFKNLHKVDIRFGPFTCIAGANGIGKSNVFDAIQFLSLLSNHSIMEAAAHIRDDAGRADAIRNIFRNSQAGISEEIEFEAEMIVPQEAFDDLNQSAKPTTTFLRYILHLRWEEDPKDNLGQVRISREELTHIRSRDASRSLGFPNKPKGWRDQVLKHGKRTVAYISTEQPPNAETVINRHADGGSGGKPQPLIAKTLPRTVLSRANADEAPTALCARREMESWRNLQLEPSSLRQPDTLNAPAILTPSGGHLPATLYRLEQSGEDEQEKEQIMQTIANRLRELVPDVRRLRIEKNEKLERLTLYVGLRDGIEYAARSLSDGTLRFLALVVLEADPQFQGVVCFEEPENGIHPARIQNIINLLRDIATDPREDAGSDNPLRQVIINTHSPSVVKIVPDDSLLLACPVSTNAAQEPTSLVTFKHLKGTWRASDELDFGVSVAAGAIFPYLDPSLPEDLMQGNHSKRVGDREDAQDLFPFARP